MVSELIAFAFAWFGQKLMMSERHKSIGNSYAVLVLGKDSRLFNLLKLMTACNAFEIPNNTSEKLQVTLYRHSYFTLTRSAHVLLTSSAPSALTTFIIFAHVWLIAVCLVWRFSIESSIHRILQFCLAVFYIRCEVLNSIVSPPSKPAF